MLKRRSWIPVVAVLFLVLGWACWQFMDRPPYRFLEGSRVFLIKVWPKGRDADLLTVTYTLDRPYEEVVAAAEQELPGQWKQYPKSESIYSPWVSLHKWDERVRAKATSRWKKIPRETTCTAYIVRPATYVDRFRVFFYRLQGKVGP